MSTQIDQSEGCDCCGFETSKTQFYKWNDFTNKRGADNTGRWLCGLCAGTMTSTYDEYPRQHTDQEPTALKTICYVGNAILRALEKPAKWEGTDV
jgi:hypothetical protein